MKIIKTCYKFFAVIIASVIIVIAFQIKVAAQYANQNLNNLTSPTKINQSLLPLKDSSKSLGSSSKAWKNIYFRGSIYYGNSLAIFFRNTNTSVGLNALLSNTAGNNNTATGYNALYFNKGNSNTATGFQAMYSNTTGNYNTAFGVYAMLTNSTGSENTALGFSSLKLNTTGSFNTTTGKDVLYSNTTGSENTAVGHGAMFGNIMGNENSAFGRDALHENFSGNYNIANGYEALYNNISGNFNTGTGYQSLYHNDDGTENTADGLEALYNNTSGFKNTASGAQALGSNITGVDNTAVGASSLGDNIDGYGNTAVGYGADVNNGSLVRSSAFGYGTYITASDQVRIGSVSVTSIGGYVGWSNISDGRVKKNIKQNVPGLEFINKLQPVTYNLDLDAADKIMQRPVIKDKEGKVVQPGQNEIDARKAKEQILYTGFIAQDVEKVAKSLNYDFSGVDAAKNDKDLYGLRYGDFVVPLVKAIQELSQQNDDLKQQNDSQQKQIDDLRIMMQQLQQSFNKCSACTQQSAPDAQNQLSGISSASLEQNIPNPFNHTSTINYTLPQQYTEAKIAITDNAGKTLKEVNISGSGKGSIKVDASLLASGSYHYSLYVNGNLVTTKQMINAK